MGLDRIVKTRDENEMKPLLEGIDDKWRLHGALVALARQSLPIAGICIALADAISTRAIGFGPQQGSALYFMNDLVVSQYAEILTEDEEAHTLIRQFFTPS